MMKEPVRVVGERKFLRVPVKTKIVTEQDNIIDVIRESAQGILQPGDVITVSEKVVAITQGRAYRIDQM